MNRKVGHAYNMVIYTMDGLGEVGFPLIQLGAPVLHINTTINITQTDRKHNMGISR